MVDYWQLVLLGAIAGFTIFLGLPIAAIKNVSANKKGFLNALALGILVFLIIDVFSHAWESTESAAKGAFSGSVTMSDEVLSLIALFGGIAIGIVAHIFIEVLAIGQSYVAGEFGLAILLIIVFVAHNATEVFGISGP